MPFERQPLPAIDPCPFCTSTNTRVDIICGDTAYYVTCDDCGAEGPHLDEADRRDAILAWNHREVTERVMKGEGNGN